MYHAMAQLITLVALKEQTPVFVMQKFDFIEMLENLARHKINTLSLVPPIAVALAKHPMVSKYDLSAVERVLCGAAPLGSEVSRELENR